MPATPTFRVLLVESELKRLEAVAQPIPVIDFESVTDLSQAAALIREGRFGAVLIDGPSVRLANGEAPTADFYNALEKSAIAAIHFEERVQEMIWSSPDDHSHELMSFSDLNASSLVRCLRHLCHASQLKQRLQQEDGRSTQQFVAGAEMIEKLPCPIIVIDEDGFVLYLNTNARALVKGREHEFLGSCLGTPVEPTLEHPFTEIEFIDNGSLKLIEMRHSRSQWYGKPAYFLYFHSVKEVGGVSQEATTSH